MNTFFFQLALGMFLVIAIIQIAAGMFDWYYIFPRLDIPMHVFGGMLVGFVVLAFTRPETSPIHKLLWVVFWALFIGILIEAVEWVIDIAKLHPSALQTDLTDTYTDILHDWIGGMIAYCIGYFSKKL